MSIDLHDLVGVARTTIPAAGIVVRTPTGAKSDPAFVASWPVIDQYRPKLCAGAKHNVSSEKVRRVSFMAVK